MFPNLVYFSTIASTFCFLCAPGYVRVLNITDLKRKTQHMLNVPIKQFTHPSFISDFDSLADMCKSAIFNQEYGSSLNWTVFNKVQSQTM